MDIHSRISSLLEILNEGLFGKEEAIKLALLAAISGESIFFLGAPGCAKSMIARRVASAFKTDKSDSKGVKYFEYLMNQFSTPEDVFGPISLKSLENDEYRRVTTGFLPEADVAFLDEIWKASPAIQNTLLTIINERKFHNGNEAVSVPLKALLAASNELPAQGMGLEALYDRFIIRKTVGYVNNEDDFFDMIEQPSSTKWTFPDDKESLKITNEEMVAWQGEIDAIAIPDEVRTVISQIRKALAVNNQGANKTDNDKIVISDRRWKKIAHIMRASAFLNGRNEVDLMDCQLISHCIWNKESDIDSVNRIIESSILQNGIDCDSTIDGIKVLQAGFEDYVNQQFYVQSEKTPVKEVMKDSNKAFVLMDSTRVHSYHDCDVKYICPNTTHSGYNDRHGAYYDENRDKIGDYDYFIQTGSFSITKDNVSWVDGYRINSCTASLEMKGIDGLVKNPTVFNTPDFLEMRQSKADQDKYTPIKEGIEGEINRLSTFKNEKMVAYKSNLFADMYTADLILNKITEEIKHLEDALVSLDKIRNRYMK